MYCHVCGRPTAFEDLSSDLPEGLANSGQSLACPECLVKVRVDAANARLRDMWVARAGEAMVAGRVDMSEYRTPAGGGF